MSSYPEKAPKETKATILQRSSRMTNEFISVTYRIVSYGSFTERSMGDAKAAALPKSPLQTIHELSGNSAD